MDQHINGLYTITDGDLIAEADLVCYTTLSELLVTTQKRNLGIAAYKKRRGFDFRAVLFIFLFH